MTLCRLMQDDYKGLLEGFTPEEAYSEYDLRKGIEYCEGWLSAGRNHDLIGDFNLKDFMKWCRRKLQERTIAKKIIGVR